MEAAVAIDVEATCNIREFDSSRRGEDGNRRGGDAQWTCSEQAMDVEPTQNGWGLKAKETWR